MTLSPQRIVMVGGSAGIGLVLARQLAASGAELIIASRSEPRLLSALAQLEGRVSTRTLDAGNEADVIRFMAEIGPFDHLIATLKPVLPHALFLQSDSSEQRRAMDGKFWGQYYLARHAAGQMRPGGSITLTSGIAASRGYPGFAIVAAINGAVEALVRSLAVELAPLRVNAVCPGFIASQQNDNAREQRVRQLAPHLPLERLGQAAEVAAAYRYLLECSYANGSIVTVDGGVLCA